MDLTVQFPYYVGVDPVGQAVAKDLDVNCLHLLDNRGRYAQMSNRNATNGTRGPGMSVIIGALPGGSQLNTGGYSSYQTGYTTKDRHHGWAGVFGNGNSGQGPVGIASGKNPAIKSRNASYHSSVWQQARTSTRVTGNITESPTPGGNESSYTDSSDNVLNIRSDVWYQGVDVSNGNTIGGFLLGEKFYG